MSLSFAEWERELEAFSSGRPGGSSLEQQFLASYDLPRDRARIGLRYRELTARFGSRYKSRELFAARAPGRINLIGEHTDYNGLPVLPMAINRDIAALCAPRPDRRVILSSTEAAFPERSFELEEAISPYAKGDWGNYCKAAVQGLLEHYKSQGRPAESFRGFQAAVDGDIPIAAGMSSSSALVVLSSLLFLQANSLEMDKMRLADLLAKAEHYVGTQGGGMDQAVSLMGRRGQALKIDFFPLRLQAVRLPEGITFVATNSLIEAAKSASALDQYNRRPIECRLAAAVLKKELSRRLKRDLPIRLLGDLNENRLSLAEEEIRRLADSALHEAPYSLREIAALLEQSTEQTAKTYCLRRDGSIFPQPADGFKLWQRYQHVSTEGRRVERSLLALREGDIAGFGKLMNESHASCRDLYEISCPELDTLVELSREAGALGSRLTGAGFGGCAISLLEDGQVEAFTGRILQSYYRDFLKSGAGETSALVFPCQSVNGAEVLA